MKGENMENTYNVVPNIITGKDLDYLSDMFEWNYGAYKSTCSASKNVTEEDIKEMLTKASNIFHSNLELILNVLGGSYE